MCAAAAGIVDTALGGGDRRSMGAGGALDVTRQSCPATSNNPHSANMNMAIAYGSSMSDRDGSICPCLDYPATAS